MNDIERLTLALVVAAKLEHQAAVEIQPNSIRSRFTPWVRHGRLARSKVISQAAPKLSALSGECGLSPRRGRAQVLLLAAANKTGVIKCQHLTGLDSCIAVRSNR
jgi:hypothetical protein